MNKLTKAARRVRWWLFLAALFPVWLVLEVLHKLGWLFIKFGQWVLRVADPNMPKWLGRLGSKWESEK